MGWLTYCGVDKSDDLLLFGRGTDGQWQEIVVVLYFFEIFNSTGQVVKVACFTCWHGCP